MKKFRKRRKKIAGASPGEVVYIGAERSSPVTISQICYSPESIEERENVPLTELKQSHEEQKVRWFSVDGVHDAALLNQIGEIFNVHPLVLEDIANTKQRPKVEDFEGYLFITLKMIVYNKDLRRVQAEQVSIVILRGVVLSFIEDAGDVFDAVRARLRQGKGRIRKEGSDYLAYALLDAVVDFYFEALEELGEDIEELEDELIGKPSPDMLQQIHVFKRELINLRRAVWPLREAVNTLVRDSSDVIEDSTKIFLRDVYDHTVQVIDTVETFRDIVSGMLEVYLSSVSNKMNEIMKVLTIMSSIFIPLTFIVGVYGMNFDYMPELRWRWGYPSVMLVMTAIAATLLAVFHKRKWI